MRAHRQRVHSGVGAPGGDELAILAGHALKRFLERLLDRRPMVLALPAHERPAVIFDGQPPTGHLRIVPLGIGKPRSSSSALIGPRPARWTLTARMAPSP